MSKVQRIEGEIRFARFDAERWDQQLVSDIDGGKLDSIAERALRDHGAGRSKL